MKILLMPSLYNPNLGGVETATEELAKQYKKMGIGVSILTKKFPHNLPEWEIVNGLKVLRIKSPQNKKGFHHAVKTLKKFNDLLRSDLIHVIGIRRHMPLFGLLLSKLWSVPYIITFSGGDLLNPKDPYASQIWKEGLKTIPGSIYQADFFTTFSKSIRNLAYNCLPNLNTVKVIYGGIDVEKIFRSKFFRYKNKYILTIRRLFYAKGVDLLIQAYVKISKKYKDVDLLIVGDGPEKNNLIKLVKRLKLEKRVKLLGFLEHDETFPLLKTALIHICPSRFEGAPLINLESQATGCVALSSNIGGSPEQIRNGKTGLLFKSEDPNDLQSKIDMLIKNKNLRKKLAKNALREVLKYDWSNVAKQYMIIYKNSILKYKKKKFVPWSRLSKDLWTKIKR